MKIVNQVLKAAKSTRRGVLRTWATFCESYFQAVSSTYPELIQANAAQLGKPTIELLESGDTRDTRVGEPQYPRLSVDPFGDPATRALYEVGAISLHASGDPVVEPTPAALLRGLARLSLPRRYLRGIINATRERRGAVPMDDAEFDALNAELFASLRRGLNRSIGERWFGALNQGAYYLHRGLVLPCTRLPGSQEFYEEGINFYRQQGADANVFIYSTTSGLVVPREFRGGASKNHYRYQYFTRGILGSTACSRVYQWERYRTARELALGYTRATTDQSRKEYLNESYQTLERFGSATGISIHEVRRFSTWKSWCTLVGPVKQQLSIRDKAKKLKIGHGMAYDATPFKKRADLLADFAKIISAGGVAGAAAGKEQFVKQFGPAVAVAAAACAVGNVATKRLSNVLRNPILRRCKKDLGSVGTRTIKPADRVLSRGEVVAVVDGLLEDGVRILRSEERTKDRSTVRNRPKPSARA